MNDKQNQMILAYLAAIEETLRQQSAAVIMLTDAVVRLVERIEDEHTGKTDSLGPGQGD